MGQDMIYADYLSELLQSLICEPDENGAEDFWRRLCREVIWVNSMRETGWRMSHSCIVFGADGAASGECGVTIS